MTKAWIVTTGQYDDYTIKGVFSSIEKARDYASSCAHADYVYQMAEIAECVLDDPEAGIAYTAIGSDGEVIAGSKGVL